MDATQRAILDFIVDSVKANGYPPSIREIGAHIGMSSSASPLMHLVALENEGYIRRGPGPRMITVVKADG